MPTAPSAAFDATPTTATATTLAAHTSTGPGPYSATLLAARIASCQSYASGSDMPTAPSAAFDATPTTATATALAAHAPPTQASFAACPWHG